MGLKTSLQLYMFLEFSKYKRNKKGNISIVVFKSRFHVLSNVFHVHMITRVILDLVRETGVFTRKVGYIAYSIPGCFERWNQDVIMFSKCAVFHVAFLVIKL